MLATNAITGATKLIAEMALWEGQGVDAIRDIPSAGDLVGDCGKNASRRRDFLKTIRDSSD